MLTLDVSYPGVYRSQDHDGETYTLHYPKNFLPAAATHMSFETRELNAIGHFPINSRMNERYDRSVCASEFLLRNAVIQKMVSRWNTVESFRLPETVPGSGRIGKDPSTSPTSAVELKCSQGTLPVESTAQLSTS